MNVFSLIPSKDAPAGFPFLENHVRAQLGLPKDEIRQLRQTHMKEGTDWCLRHKRIWITQAGVDALLKLKGVDPKKSAPNAQTPNADDGGALKPKIQKKSAPQKDVVELLVVRPTKNPHIVAVCSLEDNPANPKKPLRLRVRSAENFRRGITVKATLVAGYTDMFDLHGPPPRKMAFTPRAI